MPYEKSTPSSPEANSGSPVQANLQALADLFPSVVRDGQVDVDALRQLCGEAVVKDDELFGLNWRGKAEARAAALTPSLGTLRPCKEESKDWDTTQNLYIEGDNLEVLKLLRKSYASRVKMIFIDPPYNTGKEFVYPDNYQDSIGNYKELTGQNGKFAVNTETSGRFHTDWLNMMYPRLVIARELLSDDGVIFISIDDNEQSNLKKICDEIFGVHNFVAMFMWEKKKKPSFLHRNVGKIFDYILCYAKNITSTTAFSIEKTTEGKKYPINNAGNTYSTLVFPPNSVTFSDKEGTYAPQDMSEGNIRTVLKNQVVVKDYRNVTDIVLEGEWRYSQAKVDEIIANGEEIKISKSPFRPNHIKSGGEVKKMKNALTTNHYNCATNEDATEEIIELFSTEVFDSPKPTMLIKLLIMAVTYDCKDALVLDFFSGSATTAHAVMEANMDGGKRRHIMIQLPEHIDPHTVSEPSAKKTAENACSFLSSRNMPHNLCEIGKERIRRAGEKVKEEAGLEGQKLDIGFRVYKLDSSNVKAWNPQPEDLVDAMESYGEHLVTGRTEDDFLTEIMLKSGIDLTEEIETRNIVGHTVHSLGYGQYYACMDANLAKDYEEVALGIAAWHEEEVAAAGGEQQDICTVFVLDNAFTMDDAAKMNFVAILEQHGICNIKAL